MEAVVCIDIVLVGGLLCVDVLFIRRINMEGVVCVDIVLVGGIVFLCTGYEQVYVISSVIKIASLS